MAVDILRRNRLLKTSGQGLVLSLMGSADIVGISEREDCTLFHAGEYKIH
jgi:hypothetical protein